MNKRIIYLVIFLALLGMMLGTSSCKSYYLNRFCRSELQIKDSIQISIRDSVNIQNRDSIIITKGGSVETDLGNPCDSITGKLRTLEYKFRNGSNTTTISTVGGKLIVKSDCENQVNHYKLLSEYYKSERDTALMQNRSETKVIEKRLSWWERCKVSGFGDISFVISMMAILYVIHKLMAHVRGLPHG